MFSKEQIEALKSKIDIVEYIGKFIQLKKSGKSYWGKCPFHTDNSPSFSVSYKGGGIWKCFSNPDCGSGDVFSFYQKYYKVDFTTALIELSKNYNMPLELSDDLKVEYELKSKMYEINKEAIKFYTNGLKYNNRIKAYLKGRNITSDIIQKFSIGSDDMVSNHLTSYMLKKYTEQDLLDAGLLAQTEDGRIYEPFAHRVVIPIFDENQRPVAFTARTILDKITPKYRNTKSTLIYDKSDVLYGLNWSKTSIQDFSSVILMEGQFDIIRSISMGINNVVALSGLELHAKQMYKLAKLNVKNYYICLDTDKAGTEAIDKTYNTIKEYSKSANVRIISWR